jgi:uncharacterized membrane protein YdbT with pleckstrin-like domain
MDAEELQVKPSLRYHTWRFALVIIGYYYLIEFLLKIPKRGLYIFEIWLPKNEFLRKNLMWALKANISSDTLRNLLLITMSLLTGYALFFILKTITTSFGLTYKYIEYSHGILSRAHDTVDMVTVRDQEMSQNLYERVLGLGTVKITSKDESHPILKMTGLAKNQAEEVLDFLRVYSSRSIVDYRMTQDLKKTKKKKDLISDEEENNEND